MWFLKMQKRGAETLIKPVQNEDFGVIFPRMDPRMIRKHYLEKVVATRFQNVENLIKPVEFHVFQNAKTRCGNPYKTRRKWRLLGHFFANCPKNDQESIIKLMKNAVSQNAKTHCKNPYKTCRKRRLWGPFFGIGPQNDQKALPREGFRNAFSERRKTL